MAVKRAGASQKRGSPRKAAKKNTGGISPDSPSAQIQSETETEIRRRAYELYEARGRADGFDREDWIQAEAEVLSRLQNKESA